MILTDTHTHLYSDSFDLDREQVIKNAITQGVSRFFIPAIDTNYTQCVQQRQLAQQQSQS